MGGRSGRSGAVNSGGTMKNDFWVVDVLHDIGKYADENELSRLSKAMKSATEEFLDDMRGSDRKGIARLGLKETKPPCRQSVVPFPKKVKH